jgi:hypothetical protein
MSVSRVYIEALIAKLEPSLRKAFQQAIDDWRNNVDLNDLAAALARGDIEGAIRAANIQPAALNGLIKSTEAAFEAGGVVELQSLALKIVFDARNLRGEAQLRQFGASMVQGITDDTKDMLRTVLTDGLARGQGALSTARQVKTWIGITDNQAGYALNLERKLMADPKSLLAEFQAGAYKLRDARLDGIVRRAVRDGKPIAVGDIQSILAAYKNRSIAWRAQNIARTETLSAVNAGRDEAYRQAVDSGKVSAQSVRKVWNTTMDGRERETHAILNGESVGLNEAFVSVSGSRLRYPGDKLAPLSETAQCRCNLTYRIDHLANVKFAA